MQPESYHQALRRLEPAYPFLSLVRSVGGVVQRPVALRQSDLSAPEFSVFSANLGYLTMTAPQVCEPSGKLVNVLGGAGGDEDPDLALIRCVAEAAERYATCVHSDDSAVVASAHELGTQALDLDSLPKCSARELADPKCPVRSPDKSLPIRWIKGYSLTRRRPVYIPRVLVHLYVSPWKGENFSYPVSTGAAAHTSLPKALVTAIAEVVERDAIALTWLARLRLPRVEVPRPVPARHRVKFERMRRSLLDAHFFDATTDVGLPTIYSVQALEAHPTAARFVSCSSEFDPMDACAKIVREAASGRLMFEEERQLPAAIEDFMALEEGAAYMGRAEHRAAFDFLLHSGRSRELAQVGAAATDARALDDTGRLRWLLARLQSLGMEVAVADMTTDELRSKGLWVVRAVIPQLMPMSTYHRARFLGHPRLYDYPKAAGFGALSEHDINPFPQPFA